MNDSWRSNQELGALGPLSSFLPRVLLIFFLAEARVLPEGLNGVVAFTVIG